MNNRKIKTYHPCIVGDMRLIIGYINNSTSSSHKNIRTTMKIIYKPHIGGDIDLQLRAN